ncbi:hypothetical protein Y032_0157g3204 [Ancylostoma ceylanicum]|uniref:Uncharacterized protein n=1 Tax=Ancylostoma ceylanicum TaxID=53326 RepID=A0A016SY66_9BILA|nr:hypothetical protein Y032_0157g3204 [Ancylostoma ceylanicum]
MLSRTLKVTLEVWIDDQRNREEVHKSRGKKNKNGKVSDCNGVIDTSADACKLAKCHHAAARQARGRFARRLCGDILWRLHFTKHISHTSSEGYSFTQATKSYLLSIRNVLYESPPGNSFSPLSPRRNLTTVAF